MENVAVGIIQYKGKVIIGSVSDKKKNKFNGIPYVLIGGDIDSKLDVLEQLKKEIYKKIKVSVKIGEKVAERIHPVTKAHISYFYCEVIDKKLPKVIKSKFYKQIFVENVFTASLKMLTLYLKVFEFMLRKIGDRTLPIHEVDEYLEWAKQDIEKFGGKIRDGEIVAFPTETVYGLGADAKNTLGVQKIFEAKGRPADNPLIVHVASLIDVKDIASSVSNTAKALFQKFSPGPITVLLKKRNDIPNVTTGGSKYVGVRIPNNAYALELIQASGAAIAAPSANPSGKPSATHHQHVIDAFGSKVKHVIKAGQTGFGVESTVVKPEKDGILILRQGAITKEQIQKAFPNHKVEIVHKEKKNLPVAPGTRYRHYAPKAKMHLVEWSSLSIVTKEIIKQISSRTNTLVIAVSEVIKNLPKEINFIDLGSIKNLRISLNKLYKALLDCDKSKVENIVIHLFPNRGLGRTINDRIIRASS